MLQAPSSCLQAFARAGSPPVFLVNSSTSIRARLFPWRVSQLAPPHNTHTHTPAYTLHITGTTSHTGTDTLHDTDHRHKSACSSVHACTHRHTLTLHMLIHLYPHHNITQTIRHTPHVLWPHSKHTHTTELMSGLAWCPPLGSCPQPWHLPPIKGRDQSISIFLHFSSGPCTKSLPVIAWTWTPPTVTTVTVPPPSRSQTPLPCFWQKPFSLPLLPLQAQTSTLRSPSPGLWGATYPAPGPGLWNGW